MRASLPLTTPFARVRSAPASRGCPFHSLLGGPPPTAPADPSPQETPAAPALPPLRYARPPLRRADRLALPAVLVVLGLAVCCWLSLWGTLGGLLAVYLGYLGYGLYAWATGLRTYPAQAVPLAPPVSGRANPRSDRANNAVGCAAAHVHLRVPSFRLSLRRWLDHHVAVVVPYLITWPLKIIGELLEGRVADRLSEDELRYRAAMICFETSVLLGYRGRDAEGHHVITWEDFLLGDVRTGPAQWRVGLLELRISEHPGVGLRLHSARLDERVLYDRAWASTEARRAAAREVCTLVTYVCQCVSHVVIHSHAGTVSALPDAIPVSTRGDGVLDATLDLTRMKATCAGLNEAANWYPGAACGLRPGPEGWGQILGRSASMTIFHHSHSGTMGEELLELSQLCRTQRALKEILRRHLASEAHLQVVLTNTARHAMDHYFLRKYALPGPQRVPVTGLDWRWAQRLFIGQNIDVFRIQRLRHQARHPLWGPVLRALREVDPEVADHMDVLMST